MYFQHLAGGVDVHPERLSVIRLSGPAEVGLRGAYGAAMRREHSDMPLSKRGGPEYLALRQQRRHDLEAIIRTGVTPDNREKALDLVCAICEEPYWAEQIAAPFDDDAHPAIDVMAARTANLIAWALRQGGFHVSARARMHRELRRRVIMPLIAHDDYEWLKPETPRTLTVLSEIITAALLGETDKGRLHTFLRRVVPVLEAAVSLRRFTGPIAGQLEDWAAATALWHVARVIAPAPSLSRALPAPQWLDALLFAHLGEGVFVDPMGNGLAAGLNGADIYFIGASAGDDAVEALGAEMGREEPREMSALSARLTYDPTMGMLANSDGAPRYKHSALSDNSIMSARGGGAYVTMHTGGSGGAGGLIVYFDERPALIGGTIRIAGTEQMAKIAAGDSDFDEHRADMSVDMTACYPRSLGTRFVQRTLMLDRLNGVMRMIDTVECDKPGEYSCDFYSLEKPAREQGGLKLGAAFMTWDGDMDMELSCQEPDGIFGGMYRVRLKRILATGSNMLNYIIERT